MSYYDSISRGYDELHSEEQEKKLGIIRQHLKVRPNDRLLDVGCGTGISSGFDCFVVGIDPSMGLLRQSRKLRVQAVAESLPFKDHSFDIVVSVTALHNFEDVDKALAEIRRVGKDRFALTVLKDSRNAKGISQKIKSSFWPKCFVVEQKDYIFAT